MHSVDSDPKPIEVFQSVSRLIVEGRIPGLAPRGFGEGPHCIQFFKNTGKVHTCLPDNRLVSGKVNHMTESTGLRARLLFYEFFFYCIA